MHDVSLLALAIQEQVAGVPAYVADHDGQMYLWIAIAVGLLALVAALMLARAVTCRPFALRVKRSRAMAPVPVVPPRSQQRTRAMHRSAISSCSPCTGCSELGGQQDRVQ